MQVAGGQWSGQEVSWWYREGELGVVRNGWM